jgi:cell division initiation protein
MKITPIDVAHKSFSRQFMGFNQAEVLDFLSQVAVQLESVIHERNSLKEVVRERDLQIIEFKDRDQMMQTTLNTASQMADQIRSDAEREAKLIIAEANRQGEKLTQAARDSLKEIYQDMANLRKTRFQFESNLKAMVSAHLTLIEQSDKFLPSTSMQNMTLPDFELGENKSSEISPLSADFID